MICHDCGAQPATVAVTLRRFFCPWTCDVIGLCDVCYQWHKEGGRHAGTAKQNKSQTVR